LAFSLGGSAQCILALVVPFLLVIAKSGLERCDP
jgi:hypothetical protein